MRNRLPTILTLLRIVLLPVIVLVFYIDAPWARPLSCLIFIVAGITDWADGYLARRWGVESRFGAFLDPVADKLMVATALILIVEFDDSSWLTIPAIVIIGREITISALREWMAEMGQRGKVAVGWLGKVKTTMQIVALSLLLYLHDVFGLPTYQIGVVALQIATVLTIWSMLGYMRAAFAGEPATDHVQ
ncbi:MAG: CDP-diacylglycerol--glycerol-3-phosphate 3-phosphatidyltransferase [Gammaproteobacteria bacterium]|nr:MAG: CDP-diacylglycerol--glycerol-3-phosphate 3-phosphatidyltransferase [Gammaproteobacteria bacterium]PIE36609.1 MAG: CDP-diacylglycerol--glycerol-3-phosphate 3-phosphatidyltransferase [Gammaproteobacteria bacterium]